MDYLENREGIVDRQFGLAFDAVTGETMGLEDGDHRTVDQATAVDRGHHIVVAVELTDQRNHGLSEGFTIDPFTETLVGLLSHMKAIPSDMYRGLKKGATLCRPRPAGAMHDCRRLCLLTFAHTLEPVQSLAN